MSRLRRPDGAEIEWRLDGENGPLVAVGLQALQPPAVCRPFVEELARDHRVLTYDLRGTGESNRRGPYDMETDAADLAALVEVAGGDALAVGLGDGARRAVRGAAVRPDLVHTVAISGEVPLGRSTGARGEALAESPAVLDALLELLEVDYRKGLRTMFTSSGESEWHTMALRDGCRPPRHTARPKRALRECAPGSATTRASTAAPSAIASGICTTAATPGSKGRSPRPAATCRTPGSQPCQRV